jgi:two-component system KDP operon response regulator KdpE
MCVVLIIEDDRETNEAIAAALVTESYDCVTAYDGLQGLEKLVAQCPDVVLLDLELPGIEGTELLLRKAQLPPIAKTPVIIITGLSNPPILDGTVGILRKPFSLEDLLGALEVAKGVEAAKN